MEDIILAALKSRNIDLQEGHDWIAINSSCLDPRRDSFNVSVNKRNGNVYDNKLKEGYTWSEFCAKIDIEIDNFEARPLTAAEISKQIAEAERYAKWRRDQVNLLLNFGPISITTPLAHKINNKSYEDQFSEYKEIADNRIKYSRFRNNEMLGSRDIKKTFLSETALNAAFNYLYERDALEFAAKAGALIGHFSYTGSEKPWDIPDFEIRWPIFPDISKIAPIGLQREFGRGHRGKKMLGEKSGGSLFVPPRHGSTLDTNILIISEGAMTARAVWMHFDVNALIKFDAGNLSKIDGELFNSESAKKNIKEVWILADNDESQTGQKASQRAAENILVARPNIIVKIFTPPDVGKDWDDIEHSPVYWDFKKVFNDNQKTITLRPEEIEGIKSDRNKIQSRSAFVNNSIRNGNTSGNCIMFSDIKIKYNAPDDLELAKRAYELHADKADDLIYAGRVRKSKGKNASINLEKRQFEDPAIMLMTIKRMIVCGWSKENIINAAREIYIEDEHQPWSSVVSTYNKVTTDPMNLAWINKYSSATNESDKKIYHAMHAIIDSEVKAGIRSNRMERIYSAPLTDNEKAELVKTSAAIRRRPLAIPMPSSVAQREGQSVNPSDATVEHSVTDKPQPQESFSQKEDAQFWASVEGRVTAVSIKDEDDLDSQNTAKTLVISIKTDFEKYKIISSRTDIDINDRIMVCGMTINNQFDLSARIEKLSELDKYMESEFKYIETVLNDYDQSGKVKTIHTTDPTDDDNDPIARAFNAM